MNKNNWDIYAVYATILGVATALLYFVTKIIIDSI
jgi:hypothetical protein